MTIPLSHVLHDFGRRGARPVPQDAAGHALGDASGRAAPDAVPDALAEERAARMVDEAFARGEEAGRAAAAAELEARLAAEQASAEERLAAEHRRWRSEHADELAARLAAGIEELESRVNSAVARVLAPFLSGEVRAHMLDGLSDSIRTLLSGPSKPALRIRGPEDLLGELREKLGAVPVSIEWAVGRDADVRVTADNTLIETELQKWGERLAEAGR